MKRLSTYFFPKFIAILACLFIFPAALLAEGPPKKSSLDNPMAMVLVTVIVVLGLVILIFGYVLTGAAQLYMKKQKEEQPGKTNTLAKTTTLLLLLCFTGSAMGQDATEAVVVRDSSIAGLEALTFWALISVVGLELIVILAMAFLVKRLLAKEVLKIEEVAEEKETWLQRLWQRANNFRSIKEEATIELDHSYDGIRELDNKLPPWWLYGFYCTILFAVIYLWRFEVVHTAPSSLQEYTAEVQKGEEEKEAYLAKAANNVDENTVQLLDEGGIAQGKAIFTTVCAACHSTDGGGGVGPNLTDDYWLHGGSLKDIFKTIKYGVQEKGMKSWKDDYSPVQIAQLSSYIKSIHGVKPATPKEPQGELFKDAPEMDSTKKTASITP
jgi:cytochrome c oxidase cbb3-type subunit 3